MSRKSLLVRNIIYPAASVAAFILLWTIVAAATNSVMILPSPLVTLQELGKFLIKSTFWLAVFNTLLRSLFSFLLSLVLALILSTLSALSGVIKKMVAPIVMILRSVPTMSVILLLLIWFNPSIAPVLVSMLIIFPTLYSNFLASFLSCDGELLQMSKIYKVSKFDTVTKLLLPGIAPSMFAAIGSGISLNFKLIIAAEVLAQTKDSLGRLMQLSKIYIDTAGLLALTVAAVIICFLLEGLVALISRILRREK